MNEFSQYLSSLIAQKNAAITQMAAFCGVDRSTMYKIVHGTRKPASEELIHEISCFLKLTPTESDLLIRSSSRL